MVEPFFNIMEHKQKTHLFTGLRGESLALAYLEEKGYEILEMNWRYSRAEVDLIARLGEQLIFVEVKTRESYRHGYPEDDVQVKKQQLLSDAAAAYMEDCDHDGEIRFDIISIILPPQGEPDIRHIEDAFFPGLF